MEKDLSEKVKADAGWNDPPMLNYSSSNPPPKSRIGNKRVAYPLFTNKEQKAKQSQASQIPLKTPPSNPIRARSVSEQEPEWNSDEALSKTVENFDEVLNKSDFEQKQPINKMLQSMKNMWEQQKLPIATQKLIYNVSKYLIDKDIENAEKCYTILKTENGALCGSWLIGLRHLINKV